MTQINLVADQGANFIQTFDYSNPLIPDMTGYSSVFVVYRYFPKTCLRSAYTVGPYINATSDAGLITVSATSVLVNVPAATTAALAVGVYDYYIDIISPTFDITRITEGLFEMTQEVTY